MKRIIISVLGVLVILGVGAVALGFFPVAKVEGKYILYRNVAAVENAYNSFKTVVKDKNPSLFGVESGGGDLRKSVLDELIIQKVVERRTEDFNRDEIEREATESLENAKKNTDASKLGDAARNLYGMEYSDFEAVFLVPEAREIALRKRVEASGTAYGTWLGDKMKQASVRIYFLPYMWRDGQVENK